MDLQALAGGVLWIDEATDLDALLEELDDGWAIARATANNETTKESLITTIGAALNFPDWAGRNLDALYDLLTDLDWLVDESGRPHNVAVVLDRSASVEDWDKIVYVLLDAAAWWQPDERSFLAILR